MNNTIYAKIKDDLFGGLFEFLKEHWSKLILSTALYLLLMLLVSGYPLFLYISKVTPMLTDFMEEASNGERQDPEAMQNAIATTAAFETLLLHYVLSIFGIVIGTWFHLSWLKMGRDIILKGNLQPGESYLWGHKLKSYINAVGYAVVISLATIALAPVIAAIAPNMNFPVTVLVIILFLMVAMQLYLVVPYIYLEELSILDAIKKSLVTITPLKALKYAMLILIGLFIVILGVIVSILLISGILSIISPAIGAMVMALFWLVFFVIFMVTVISFPSIVYYHHTDVSTKDYESSPYDSFG